MRIDLIRNAANAPVAVNGVAIPHAEIAREVQNHRSASPSLAWKDATRALVVRELLLQRARVLGLAAEPRSEGGIRESEEEALIRTLLETEVRSPKATEAECRRFYDVNSQRFRSPDLFEPRHILFQAAEADEEAYAAALRRAEAALAEVLAHPERFDALARAHSDCASASEGGRLGQIVRGETTPAFEAALFRLQPGEICPEPVRTPYGVHVLRLDHRADGAVVPFEHVRERIATWLEEKSWRTACAQYIALLAGDAEITGFSMTAATSPLVQ